MIISKMKTTADLPDAISQCQGTVFIVLDQGEVYPINEQAGTLNIFRKLWLSQDYDEVELLCSEPADIGRLMQVMSKR